MAQRSRYPPAGGICAIPVLFRKRFWRCGLLPSLASQRVKKRHKIALLLVRQFERKDQWVLMWILHPTLVVKVHDFFQSFETAVMRIRPASGDLPQGRGFKCADVLSILGHHVTAKIYFVVVPADAKVVELFVGEVES